VPHLREPQNVNMQHASERADGGVNQRIAVWLTRYVGTMQTAYGFAALAGVGLLGVLAILNPSVYTFVAWLSQTFIQLVLLPVIMVGQNVLNRHAELQAEEQFHATLRTLHESEEMMRHLDAQDAELLAQSDLLLRLLATLGAQRVANGVSGVSAGAAMPASPPASPDTRTRHPRSGAASNSPASRPPHAPSAGAPAPRSARRAASTRPAPTPASSSASAH
jgi:uncharacterized membrane protein